MLLTHDAPQLRKLGVELLIDFIKRQVGGWTAALLGGSAGGAACPERGSRPPWLR